MSDEAGKFVDVPGGYVYYHTRGQGQDVVLLSAGGADLRMWETTLSWLSKVARVTMFDYRDTGLSSPGHLARRERAQADAGVYAAAEVDIDAWAPALAPHHRRKMIGLRVANSYLFALEDYLGSELDPPVKTRFGEITTPISVVVGGRDFNSTQLWAQRIANQAPDVSLTVVPEADHFPMLSAPRQFERLLREALGSV